MCSCFSVCFIGLSSQNVLVSLYIAIFCQRTAMQVLHFRKPQVWLNMLEESQIDQVDESTLFP